MLRAEVDPEVGRWLRHLTGGHPLFIVATLADLVDRGVLRVGQEAQRPPASAPVPVHVRDLLQRRLAALGSRRRRAIDVLAVVGQPLRPADLAHLLAPGDLDAAVDEGLVVRGEDGAVEFAHDLLRQVAYEDVPAGRRAELHHAAAGLDGSASHRAVHLLAALRPRPARAARRGVDGRRRGHRGAGVRGGRRLVRAGARDRHRT